MIFVAFLFPLAVYCLVLGLINRRRQPLMVSAGWDFAGLLFAASGFLWTPYAFYLDEVGPGDPFWIDAQGKRTSRWHVDAGVASPELIGGQLAADPLLGEFWVQSSDWSCSDSGSRERFGALCTG